MPCPATRQQEARAIVRTAAPIASAAALPAQPLAACPLRVASALQVGNDCSTFCAASPPNLSLRGGRRPTWQSRSTRLNRGKAIGKNAAAFPRLPRPLWGLAMTNLGALRGRRCHPITCQPARRAGSAAAGAVESHHPFNGAIISHTRRGTAACGRFLGGGTARPACRTLPRHRAPEK